MPQRTVAAISNPNAGGFKTKVRYKKQTKNGVLHHNGNPQKNNTRQKCTVWLYYTKKNPSFQATGPSHLLPTVQPLISLLQLPSFFWDHCHRDGPSATVSHLGTGRVRTPSLPLLRRHIGEETFFYTRVNQSIINVTPLVLYIVKTDAEAQISPCTL